VGTAPLPSTAEANAAATQMSAHEATTGAALVAERRALNRQLLAFHRVLAEVSSLDPSGQRPLSSRDSRLTQQLAPLLAGSCRLHLVACVRAEAEHFGETCATLRSLSKGAAIRSACMRLRGIPSSQLGWLPAEAVLPPLQPLPKTAPQRASLGRTGAVLGANLGAVGGARSGARGVGALGPAPPPTSEQLHRLWEEHEHSDRAAEAAAAEAALELVYAESERAARRETHHLQADARRRRSSSPFGAAASALGSPYETMDAPADALREAFWEAAEAATTAESGAESGAEASSIAEASTAELTEAAKAAGRQLAAVSAKAAQLAATHSDVAAAVAAEMRREARAGPEARAYRGRGGGGEASLTPEQRASVADVIGQLKMALAKNLHRIMDTFREFDEDQSGKIDKREFQLALRKLGIVAHKSAFDNTFDTFDDDRSGTLEYHELNNKLRRRVDDPSHTSAMGGGGGAATSRSRAAWPQPAEEFAEAVPSLPYTGPLIRAASAPSVQANPYAGAFGARRYEHFEPPMQMIKLPSGLCVPREVYDDVLRSAQQRYNHNGKHVY